MFSTAAPRPASPVAHCWKDDSDELWCAPGQCARLSKAFGERPHWRMGTFGKPESIHLDAYLLVISAKRDPGFCGFSLYGTLKITRH